MVSEVRYIYINCHKILWHVYISMYITCWGFLLHLWGAGDGADTFWAPLLDNPHRRRTLPPGGGAP